MATKLTLQIGILPLLIALGKATENKIGFKLGYEGQPIKTVRVVSRAEKPRSVEEIERVVQYSELKSLYDAGDKFIEIDKSIIKKATGQSSDIMKILRVIPQKHLPLNYLSGQHYYIDIQKNKQKAIPEDAKAIYTMLYEYLKSNKFVLITSYVTRGNEKTAVIYPSSDKMRMVNIIPTNLQRVNEANYLTNVDANHNELFLKLISANERKEIDDEELIDNSHEKTVEIINKILAGEKIPEIEELEEKPPEKGLLDLLAQAG